MDATIIWILAGLLALGVAVFLAMNVF